MSNVVTHNPFKIEHYSFSWSEVRKYTDNLVKLFADNYKLAYYNDFHQKIIVLINHEDNSFETDNQQILTISKIDDNNDLCLLAFEITGYCDDISSKEDFDKAWSSLQKILFYLRLFQVNMHKN
jgi:hypothetical protein